MSSNIIRHAPAPAPQTLGENILMRSIKIVDIGYISVLYIAFSLLFASLTDKIMGTFDHVAEKKKSTMQLTLELILTVWVYGVLVYIVRNLVELVPFPLNGYHGFEHKRVKELGSATVFTFTYVLFSSYIKNKIMFYYNHIIEDANTKAKNNNRA